MSKVKPTTKEQLIFFLINNINLGTYDKRFLSNLESMYLINQKPLTTNQSDLLNKIIYRYSRQLAKYELGSDEVANLPWARSPIPSLPKYTETFLISVDDELILRTPYKNNFIKDFKKLAVNAKWEHDDRFWRIPANAYTLKLVTTCIEKHYENVNYCEELSESLQNIKKLSNDICWSPTFKYVNGNFFVYAINDSLYHAIQHIPFEIELTTLARLVYCGISIDSSVKEKFKEKFEESEINFASEFTSKIDVGDSNLGNLISLLQPDLVLFSEYITSYKLYLMSVKDSLREKNIDSITVSFTNKVDVSNYNFVVLVESGMSLNHKTLPYTAKSIQITNSKPIFIK